MSAQRRKKKTSQPHPQDELLRTDRLPHIWCPGCGIGTAFSCVITAIKKSEIPLDDIAMVSGIGCTGRMAGYIKLDSFHTTHGRAIPFATGLKLAHPEGSVIVTSGDGDLLAIGGNHFIHAARRNIDLTVICVNNFNYGMTGGQQAPSTPFGAKTTTSPIGSPEQPFNFCALAAACGAVYVARWTALHIRRLTVSITEAMKKPGFSFVEILSPCPTSFGRRNRIRNPLELVQFYHERSVIRNNIDPQEAALDFNNNLVVGKFVDTERPTFLDSYRLINRRELGDWPALEPKVPIPDKQVSG
ncbi:MAG: 2-oxoacid:ferredoxin oxidoreductase subunit beta [Deltaproteobacteria bacterium]|nr:2-oxoacid:ferredoxin oxidoreductase subunit beta [Deltaproteobacteria bacterium]MBW2051039.1 2-oxoacid:ferredoxin oxidoreductase subunit beta [Deltaproteobacteria bacterium]MBW2140712.1 2-oxoacid:ferredoxin oxidoreductase subunit beta [Deltaproteobacteria bacterium]MBW2323138.1 2-oxoacid:ferredoxin oxidoreductase subunit beta [Deltaproteobacteria bacterium]